MHVDIASASKDRTSFCLMVGSWNQQRDRQRTAGLAGDLAEGRTLTPSSRALKVLPTLKYLKRHFTAVISMLPKQHP